MIRDVYTVFWKEAHELFRMQDNRRLGALALVGAPIFLGILMPLQMGRTWVETPASLAVWIWFPAFLAFSLVADSFAGERERYTLETLLATRLPDAAILLGKIAAVMLYGWGTTLLGLLVGLVTVNLAFGRGQLLLYPPLVTVAGVVLTFLVAALAATGGVLLSLRASSVRQVQQVLGLVVMVLAFVPLLVLRFLPVDVERRLQAFALSLDPTLFVAGVAGALLLADALLLVAALARFQRSRLVAD